MTISIMIATYDRKDILRKAIGAYARQTTPPLEVIIVDDGSSDGTSEAVASLIGTCRFEIRYFRQSHRGAAAARNIGIREATGQVILFTDDDIIPGPTMVAEHLGWHKKHPEPWAAVLGYMTWDPDVCVTPFMEWFQDRGPLLGLAGLRPGQELDFFQFFTGNLSLKVDYLRCNGVFDEDFHAYGWEDIELGYRLKQKGLKLFYNPNAVGYHHKRVSFAEACQRARQTRETRKILDTKDAGKHIAALEALQADLWRVRTRRLLAGWLTPLLLPLRSVVDSQIRLPDLFYRAFYYYYVKSNRGASHGEDAT